MKHNLRQSYFCRIINLFLIPCIFYFSCSNSSRYNKSDTTTKKTGTIAKNKNTVNKKPPCSFSDTLIINYPSAVIFNPDSLQKEKIRNITDSAIFESNMHDCQYQIGYSRKLIEKQYPDIKIIEAKNIRYLFYKKSNGENKYLDLNAEDDPCGIFIFNGRSDPQLIDMTNADTELGFYFSK